MVGCGFTFTYTVLLLVIVNISQLILKQTDIFFLMLMHILIPRFKLDSRKQEQRELLIFYFHF